MVVQKLRHCRAVASNGPGRSVERRWIDPFSNRQASFIRIEGNLVQGLNEWHIEPIDPDHVSVALVSVFVPAAVWSEDQVAVFHDHFLAVDVGVSALTLKDKTERRH